MNHTAQPNQKPAQTSSKAMSSGEKPGIYSVTWTVDVEIEGDHKDAAQAVADQYFQARIAAGEYDSACSFVVTGVDNFPVNIDLADSLSDLEGNDTE